MRAASTPRDIRVFEALQIASIAIGLLQPPAHAEAGLFEVLFDALFVAGPLLLLTLLVSLGRRNWARSVLTAMFLAGAGLMFWLAPLVLAQGSAALTVVITLLQAIGLAFLFTKQSSDWLKGNGSASALSEGGPPSTTS